MAEETYRTPLVEFPPKALVEIIEWFTPQRLASLLGVTDLERDYSRRSQHRDAGRGTRP
ncbi:MAG: hypothetical protein IMY86_08745 [Chloroflexi bacterium]|nr:hypothetical protein [Chloroflexota bacterium]